MSGRLRVVREREDGNAYHPEEEKVLSDRLRLGRNIWVINLLYTPVCDFVSFEE